jgi:hypothetical protein
MEKMSLSRWYGNSIRIPVHGSFRYTGFVSGCVGLVNTVVKEKLGKKVRVVFARCETAQADIEKGLIQINQDYLQGRLLPDKPPFDSDTSTTVILGIIVHEAAHFAYSEPTLEPFSRFVKEKSRCPFHEGIAMILGNIVEDIFIEAEVDREVPSLSWMLEATNAVFFTDEDVTQKIVAAAGVEAAPLELKDVATALNVLILAKTRGHLAGLTPYVSQLYEIVRTAVWANEIQQRKELVLAIYDLLMANVKLPPEDSTEATQVGKRLVEIAKCAAGLTALAGVELDDELETSYKADELNELLERLDDVYIRLESKREGEECLDEKALSSLYLERDMTAGPAIEMDARYNRLAEVARQHAVVNRPYGMDMKRGNNIRKLYRIATDQKIFAQPVAMNNYKPMQVIILVDCSGSMRRGGIDLAACRAALGAAVALCEARCEVAVYGHTADILHNNEVHIFKAKSFTQSMEGLDQRLGMMLGQQFHQNRDGYAIRYVGGKFTNLTRRRVLIVISDGAPEADNGYTGTAGLRHTKQMVQEVRSTGAEVLSISVNHYASEFNNVIYGEEWNVQNNDPNVIEQIVRALVLE